MTDVDDMAATGQARWEADRAKAVGLARSIGSGGRLAWKAAPTLALLAIAGSICWLAYEVRQTGEAIGYIDDRDTVTAIDGLAAEVKKASEHLDEPAPAQPYRSPEALPGWFGR